MGKWDVKQGLLLYKNQIIVVLTPIVCLPLPLLVPTQAALCGYVMLLMGTYWCTTALPIAVTSLLPIFLMPMLGLLSSDDVCKQYYKDSAMLFIGGLMVAVAIEKSNLHRRVAMIILMVVGTKPAWLMMGFMLATWFLSMWISNSATASMMLPIMEAVLVKLETVAVGDDEHNEDETISKTTISSAVQSYDNSAYSELEVCAKPVPVLRDSNVGDVEMGDVTVTTADDCSVSRVSDKEHVKKSSVSDGIMKSMTLSIAYSANIGGIATLTGTPPNVVMKDAADTIWYGHGLGESPVNFASWMVFGFPVSCVCIILAWMWLVVFYMGPRAFCVCGKKHSSAVERSIQKDIKQEYKSLGSLSWAEWAVSLSFILMVCLWFFRSPGFIKGWGDYFKEGYVKDSVVSVMVACFLFTIPYFMPHLIKKEYDNKEEKSKAYSRDTILDWLTVEHELPWGVVLVLGGGSALAQACLESGLSDWIGEQLQVFGSLPPYLMICVVCLLAACLTEVTSNTATCSICMPIVANMAEGLNYNPLYLMFPTAVSCSLGFLLPAATPPNAIVFSYNRVTVWDMVKCGLLLKLLVVFPALAAQTWCYSFFDFGDIPWATDSTSYTQTFSPVTVTC